MPTDPTEPPAVEFVTDESLVHKATCTLPIPPRSIRLLYNDGRVICMDCGASVPAEVRPR